MLVSYDLRANSFLFLDADPSKAMNLEERVKAHIKDLQRHIKTNILEDVGGKVIYSVLSKVPRCSHSIAAFRRRSGWHHPIVVLREGEEA